MRDTLAKNLNKVVGYCRVSTDDQADQGISLDYQEDQCRKASINDGFTDITIIRDEGKSGKNLKRKGIQEVIDLAKTRQISVVYVTHSDRLARNIEDHAFLRNTLRTSKVSLKYLNGQSSLDDASSVMADNMFATINQYHSDNTREKTRQAVDTKAKAGYFPTCAPVGYINVENPDKHCEKVAKRIIIPNPKTAHLVTEAFKTYASGQYNAYEINDLMFEKGLVSNSNKKLTYSMIYNMLRNRLYLGEIQWMDIHVVKGKHEPLIDKDTFDRVDRLLTANNRSRCRRRKYFWLLKGYMFCPIHNCRFTAEWHFNKVKAYYHCSHKNGCGKYVEKSDLENQVARKLRNIEFDSSFVDSVIEKVKLIFEDKRNGFLTEQKSYVSRRSSHEARLRTAEDRLLDGTITNNDYQRIKNETQTQVENIDRQLNKLNKGNDINLDITKEILGLTKNLYKTYMEAPETLQRKLIGLFFEGFEVKDGLIIKDRYSPLFEELLALNAIFKKPGKGEKSIDNKGNKKLIINTYRGAYPVTLRI